MSTVTTYHGSPRGYEMKAVQMPDGKFLQHAVTRCSVEDCDQTAKVPWVSTEATIGIIQKFARIGWVIFKNGKVRCPKHAESLRKQRKHFAKLGDVMPPELVKMPTPPQEVQRVPAVDPYAPAPRVEDVKASEALLVGKAYLLTITPDGAVMRPIEGAVEMMFGDVEYLAVPK